MWPFTKSEKECISGKPSTHKYVETDEYAVDRFDPIAHDGKYIYGRRHQQLYKECTECGEKFFPKTVPPSEFEKMKKEEINEATLEEVEVSTDRLDLRE